METNQTGKLPLKVKLTFSIGYLGKNLLVLLNTYFLLYFYTDVVGISASAAGVIMFIARIWDAINDPMMGVIVDKTKSKLGKCRFYLKYFSVPTAVIITISYFCPELDTVGKIIWVAITYILQGMATTIVSVPHNALMARLTDNGTERVKIGQLNSVASLIVNVAVPALTLPMVSFFGGSNVMLGFVIAAGIYSAIYAITILISYWGSKGYDNDIEKPVLNKREEVQKISGWQMFKEGLKNKYALIVSVAYIFYMLNSAIMGSTLVYYFQYNIGNTGLMSSYSTFVSIGAIIALLIMGFMYKKFGNAKTCIFACAITAFGCVLRWVTNDSVIIVFYIAMISMGTGSSLLGAHVFQCIMDACTYNKLKTGKENQAIIMSIYTFAQKFGQAMGGVVAAWLLAMVPYIPNAETQAQSVLNLFFAENIIVPLVICLGVIFVFIYIARLEKQLQKMKSEEVIKNEY